MKIHFNIKTFSFASVLLCTFISVLLHYKVAITAFSYIFLEIDDMSSDFTKLIYIDLTLHCVRSM